VLPGLEAAKACSRDGIAFGHLIGDHVQDPVERVAYLSPGRSPGTTPSCRLVYQLSFVDYFGV
jgi:hypothetical protein